MLEKVDEGDLVALNLADSFVEQLAVALRCSREFELIVSGLSASNVWTVIMTALTYLLLLMLCDC